VSDAVHRLTTEEQRERFHVARRGGGLCAACGRTLGAVETVYVERFAVGTAYSYAPVGVECASAGLLERVQGQEPERCAGCGRGIHYWRVDRLRRRVSCSKRCSRRAAEIEHRTAGA
jgi:hypothetical protein